MTEGFEKNEGLNEAGGMEEQDETEELEETYDVIELVDEEGETQEFELLASFDLNDQHYIAVAEPTEEEDPESMEVFILRTETDQDGNDTYVTVEDEEADEAFNYFLSLVDAEEK